MIHFLLVGLGGQNLLHLFDAIALGLHHMASRFKGEVHDIAHPSPLTLRLYTDDINDEKGSLKRSR